MMITHYALHYKNRVLQIFLVIALALFCFAFSKNIKTITDNIKPLSSGNVEAMFYIENPETGTVTCVGDGLLKSIGEVVANEKVVSNAIISSPDYSNYMPTNTSIVWNTIKQVGAQYQVIGQLRQINSISIADYGAVGDGVTDNYDAIQTAIEAAISSAQTVEVPTGIYYVSKKIVIPGSIHIKGTGPSSSIIIFKDDPSNSDYASYLQRGIISFKGSGLTVEDICFKYEANNYTPYTREAGQSGKEGVLFFLGDVSNVNFNNTEVTVEGKCTPSITCVWAKSETTSMDNISFKSCIFNNYSESTVGGCLWISGHDNKNTTVSNAIVNNCTFTKCGHDEAYGLWGYHVTNCRLLESTFNYIGKANNIQTVVKSEAKRS
ncbi:glycosyl hydrolase family 28-related protein [Pseudobutyrivibrio sp.]